MGRIIARISTAAVLALAALPALGLDQAAHASAAPAEPLARIRVGDLDFSRSDDARLFKARLDAAADSVCDARIRAEKLDAWSAMACRLDIQDEVRSKLSRRQARALHASGG